MYNYLKDDDSGYKTTKGTKKCATKKIKFEDQKNYLEINQFEKKLNYLKNNKIDVDSPN